MSRLTNRQQLRLSVMLLLGLILATPLQADNAIKVPKDPGGVAKEVAEPAAAQPAQGIEPQPSSHTPPQTTSQASSSEAPVADINDLPPLMPGEWKTLQGAEALQAFHKLSKALPELNSALLDDVREMRTLALPFYDQTILIEARIRGNDGAPMLLHVMSGPWGTRVLEGKSAIIHETNKLVPINLDNAEKARTYLRFFCGAVLGNDGPFNIIEQAHEMWLQTDADAAMRNQIADKLISFQVKANPEGGWRARSAVNYSNALFLTHFSITNDGFVEMLSDDTVMTDLPVRGIHYQGLARGEVCKKAACPKLPELKGEK